MATSLMQKFIEDNERRRRLMLGGEAPGAYASPPLGEVQLPKALTNPLGAVNSLVRPASVSAQSYDEAPMPQRVAAVAAPPPLATPGVLPDRISLASRAGPVASNEGRGYEAPDLTLRSVPIPPPEAPAAPGMTTEEANSLYGAQLRAMRANDATNMAAADRGSMLATQSIADRLAAERAAWAAKVDAGSITAGGKFGDARGIARAALSADVAREAQGIAKTSRGAYDASLGGQNYGAQAAGVQKAGEDAQRALIAQRESQQGLQRGQMSLAQAALLNPLAVEGARQGLATGAIDQKIRQQQYDATQALVNATTPAEEAAAERTLLRLHGKSGEDWNAIHMAGEKGVDANNQPYSKGDNVLLYNKKTKEREIINAGQMAGTPKTVSKADFAQMVKQHAGGEAAVLAMLKAKGLTVEQ